MSLSQLTAIAFMQYGLTPHACCKQFPAARFLDVKPCFVENGRRALSLVISSCCSLGVVPLYLINQPSSDSSAGAVGNTQIELLAPHSARKTQPTPQRQSASGHTLCSLGSWRLRYFWGAEDPVAGAKRSENRVVSAIVQVGGPIPTSRFP